jgi:hypothetical protein
MMLLVACATTGSDKTDMAGQAKPGFWKAITKSWRRGKKKGPNYAGSNRASILPSKTLL